MFSRRKQQASQMNKRVCHSEGEIAAAFWVPWWLICSSWDYHILKMKNCQLKVPYCSGNFFIHSPSFHFFHLQSWHSFYFLPSAVLHLPHFHSTVACFFIYLSVCLFHFWHLKAKMQTLHLTSRSVGWRRGKEFGSCGVKMPLLVRPQNGFI